MITAPEAVRLRLLALPAVVAIVDARVYVLTFPQNPIWPAIRVALVSETEALHFRGTVGRRWARVQTDVVAESYSAAAALLAAVHGTYDAGAVTGLAGFTGLVGDMPITEIAPEGRRDLYDEATEPVPVVRLSRDYGVYWREG